MSEARDEVQEAAYRAVLYICGEARPRSGIALIEALAADGWVLARRQDAEDGAALRELREAWSGTWSVHVVRSAGRVIGYTVEAWSTKTWPTVKVYGPDDGSMPDVYPTIATTARKAREALP